MIDTPGLCCIPASAAQGCMHDSTGHQGLGTGRAWCSHGVFGTPCRWTGRSGGRRYVCIGCGAPGGLRLVGWPPQLFAAPHEPLPPRFCPAPARPHAQGAALHRARARRLPVLPGRPARRHGRQRCRGRGPAGQLHAPYEPPHLRRARKEAVSCCTHLMHTRHTLPGVRACLGRTRGRPASPGFMGFRLIFLLFFSSPGLRVEGLIPTLPRSGPPCPYHLPPDAATPRRAGRSRARP